MMKLFTALFFCLVSIHVLEAQKEGQISGTLIGEQEEPLSFATVTIYQVADTALVDYILSKEDGTFSLRRLPSEVPLRMIVSYLGYEPLREEFTISAESPLKDFGRLEMIPSSQTLEEILVLAERPPVVMKNDTLEFNASSFTMRDGSTVEDLVKKLPGVVVDNAGNVTANGRPVTKVRVDGKDFFGGDPRIALRNLTSDMISKVQITDDREEDPQRLLADDQVSQVINLKLKKEARIRAFGKAYAGGGTKDRFEVGGIVNNFRDTFQLSFVGYYNNLTQTNLSMNEMMSLGSFSVNRINCGSFGCEVNGLNIGSNMHGMPLTLFGGANANLTLGGAKMNLQYFFSDSKVETESELYKETMLRPDSIFYYHSDTRATTKTTGHNIAGGLRWEIDTLTQLNINVEATVADATNASLNEEVSSFVNRNHPHQSFLTREDPARSGVDLNTGLYFNRKLSDKGRNIRFNAYFTNNNLDQNILSYFERKYFLNSIDSIVYFDQKRTEFARNQSFDVSLVYTEPITENWLVDLKTNYQPKVKINNIETLQHPEDHQDWTIIKDLSDRLKRKEETSRVGTGLRYQKNKVQIHLGVDYSFLNFSNTFGSEIPHLKEKYQFWTPNASLLLDGWRLSYRYDFRTPDVDQLHPIRNNRDPLHIREGNPDLDPMREHQLWLSKYHYSGKWNYRFYASGTLREESIIQSSRMDQNGVTYSKPVNYDGSAVNFYSGAGLNHSFDLKNQRLSFDYSLYINYTDQPFVINGQEGFSKNTGIGSAISFNYSWNDILDFAPRYDIGYFRNSYQKVDYPAIKGLNHTVRGDFTFHLPWDIQLQNDLIYRYNPYLPDDFQKNTMMWNAALNKKILADKKLTLRLLAYDLLNQNLYFTRFVQFNTLTETQNQALTRYFMVSLVYDFRKK